MNISHVRSDFKLIKREPMMLFLILLPILLIVIFTLIKQIGIGLIEDLLKIDLSQYRPYIDVMAVMIEPLMIGTVLGFLMIDEKDARILQLLVVTPIGFGGYLKKRMLMPSILCAIYTFALIVSMGIKLPYTIMMAVILMGILESLTIGFAIMTLAEDKIKGLTMAKGLSGLIVFAFADLIPVQFIKIIAYGVPYYWIGQVVLDGNFLNISLGLIVHGIYLGWMILRLRKMVY